LGFCLKSLGAAAMSSVLLVGGSVKGWRFFISGLGAFYSGFRVQGVGRRV
jgi:hypothetical protein